MPSPSENLPALYVETFRRGMAPYRCVTCNKRFTVGEPRLGYTPEASTPALPRWIHTNCVHRVGLAAEPEQQSIAFSPKVLYRDRRNLLETLGNLWHRRSSGTRVQRWNYVPAVVQHWRIRLIPKPRPRITVLPSAPEEPAGISFNSGAGATEIYRMLGDMSESSLATNGAGDMDNQTMWVPFEELPARMAESTMHMGLAVTVSRIGSRTSDGLTIGQDTHHFSEEQPTWQPSDEHLQKMCSIVEAIPDEVLNANLEDVCAICRESLGAGDAVRRLPCLHVFHRDCIDQWLLVRTTCPLDNKRLEDLIHMADSNETTQHFL